jgi:hypothetical protein
MLKQKKQQTTHCPMKQLLLKPKKQKTTDWPKKQLLLKPKKQKTTDWPKKQLLLKPKKRKTTDWPKKQLVLRPKKQKTTEWPKKQLQLQSHCQEGRVKRGLRQKVKLQMFRHVIDVKVAIRCCWHDADGLWTNFKLRCPTCWSDGKQPTDGEQAHLLVQVTLYCA